MMIRDVQFSDYENLKLLYSQLHPGDPEISDKEFKNQLDRIINNDCLFIFVLEHDELLVASCYLNIIPNLTRSATPYGVIENVICHQDFRGKGFGSSIVQHALEQAWEADCYKVMLMTGRQDDSTLKFYETAGFKPGLKQAFLAKNPYFPQ